MKKIFVITLFLFALVLSPTNAFANENKKNSLSNTEMEFVAKAQKFISQLKTLQGGFMQLDSDTSSVSRGEVYISKPGKMLLRYVDPQQADFYLVGGRIMAYDYELEQLNHTDADNTAFSVFLQPNFDLLNNLMLKVVSVDEQPTKYTVNFVPFNPDEQETKSISLSFSLNENKLVGFDRTDADGNKFEITFINTDYNKNIDDEIFVFKDPRKQNKFPKTK